MNMNYLLLTYDECAIYNLMMCAYGIHYTKFDDKHESEKSNFNGFETSEMETATERHQNFLKSIKINLSEISSMMQQSQKNS